MYDKRHRGYVIAGDKRLDGKVIWKVRVKDTESEYDGEKLSVASVHGGIELTKGLNVSFLVGLMDYKDQKVKCAVDVCLEQEN